MTDEAPAQFDFDAPHDIMLREIYVGCRVAYAVTSGRSATLRIGTILEMKRVRSGRAGWLTTEMGKMNYHTGERQYWDMLLKYDDKYPGEYGRYGGAAKVWVHFPQRCVVLP